MGIGRSVREVMRIGVIVLTTPGVVLAQIGGETSGGPPGEGNRGEPAPPPQLEAEALRGPPPTIDGVPGEPAWLSGSLASRFVQFVPREGSSATERTEARVIFGDDALFVAFWAFDSEPSEVVGPLSRRDQGGFTDRVDVVVDSYFDRRTAFQFGINPSGVKYDVYRFDDVMEDESWDAVWEGAAQRTDFGWTAEFRIPYSQLRFGEAEDQTWGIQFMRHVARKGETSVWAPLSREVSGVVSRFGELRGIEGVQSPRRLELMPYTLGRAERRPGSLEDPFYSPTQTQANLGGDLKYGLTGNLTLDLTVNPDFAQVEADPGQVNLTAFETYLPEKRPFFLEGANIYNFRLSQGDGDGANEALFYSRRVGRAPQGDVGSDVEFDEVPGLTTILGAAKVSGKTQSGWSVGTLYALTNREQARVLTHEGAREDRVVEPLSNYVVARVQKDFREGRSAVGFIGTGTARDPEDARILDLRSSAYAGGLDLRHRFWDDNWSVSGYVVGTYVSGSAEAIARTQRSPARYFQRPDADHTRYDPLRTSMAGWSGQWFVGKEAGGNWRYATGGQARSPGFEPNDLGYMREADFVSPWMYVGYDKARGSTRVNRWRLNANAWSSWSFGGEHVGLGANLNGSAQLRNFWSVFAGVNRNEETLDTRLLRGGPAMLAEGGWSGWTGVSTDSRKPFTAGMFGSWSVRSESDSRRVSLSPNVTWRPSARTTVGIGGAFSRNLEGRQWVAAVTGSGDDRRYYTFGRMDQTTVGLTARLDFAFTPTLSLQIYANPFVSAGAFQGFRKVQDPRADSYGDRFRPLDTSRAEEGRVMADVDGDGALESLGNPDFNSQQFNSNLVLRWEYRPGSALFLVWSQGLNDFDRNRPFDLGADARNLFGQAATNVLMLKVTYWLNP